MTAKQYRMVGANAAVGHDERQKDSSTLERDT